MKPTIGRIVHYTNTGLVEDGKYPSEIQAAIITGVDAASFTQIFGSLSVSLLVFYKTGMFNMYHVQYTAEPAGSKYARGKWTWPVCE
jgi:hypothetical protein